MTADDAIKLAREAAREELIRSGGANYFTLKDKFKEHCDQWYEETGHLSSASATLLNPHHLKIISMGKAVVPLILKELKERPYHWFVALAVLTDEDPVKKDSTFKEAVKAWLDWGERHVDQE